MKEEKKSEKDRSEAKVDEGEEERRKGGKWRRGEGGEKERRKRRQRLQKSGHANLKLNETKKRRVV